MLGLDQLSSDLLVGAQTLREDHESIIPNKCLRIKGLDRETHRDATARRTPSPPPEVSGHPVGLARLALEEENQQRNPDQDQAPPARHDDRRDPAPDPQSSEAVERGAV